MNIQSKITPSLALAALFSFTSLTAVETDPVGYVSIDLAEGYTSVAITFIKPSQYTGAVTSSTVSTLTLDSAPTLTGANHYLEVVSSSADLVGERIDIASVVGSVLTLDLSVSHNTLDDASVLPADTVISIREHYTVGDFGAAIESDVNSDLSFTLGGSDHILLYDGRFKRYIHYDGDWYAFSSAIEIATNVILAPGTGFFFYRNPAAAAGTPATISATFTGSVRMNNFVQKLVPGYQSVANGYPVDASPLERGYGAHLEQSENFVSGESDFVLVWDNGFKTYLPYTDGSLYEFFGAVSNVDSVDLFSPADGHFVFVKNSGKVLEIPRPF